MLNLAWSSRYFMDSCRCFTICSIELYLSLAEAFGGKTSMTCIIMFMFSLSLWQIPRWGWKNKTSCESQCNYEFHFISKTLLLRGFHVFLHKSHHGLLHNHQMYSNPHISFVLVIPYSCNTLFSYRRFTKMDQLFPKGGRRHPGVVINLAKIP